MAEIDKALTVEESTPTETEEVTVELEENTDTGETTMEEVAEASQSFFANLADDMDERTLKRLSLTFTLNY